MMMTACRCSWCDDNRGVYNDDGSGEGDGDDDSVKDTLTMVFMILLPMIMMMIAVMVMTYWSVCAFDDLIWMLI